MLSLADYIVDSLERATLASGVELSGRLGVQVTSLHLTSCGCQVDVQLILCTIKLNNQLRIFPPVNA